MASNNMKVHLICNAIKAVAGIIVIGYVCKMLRSPWPLLAMILIPQSDFKTRGDDQVDYKNDKEETPNE